MLARIRVFENSARPKEGAKSVYQPPSKFSHRFQLVQFSFLQDAGLAFSEVWPEERIQQAFEDEGVEAQGDE